MKTAIMNKINAKAAKKIATIVLATVAAFSVMGCSVEKTVTKTETYTDADGNTVTATTTQTLDKNGKVKNGTAEITVEPAEAVDDNPGFFDNDLWSISYNPDEWYGYVDDNGSVIINYLGEAAGSSYMEIKEYDGITASEVIEILEGIKGKKLTVIDNMGMSGEYTCMAYADDEVYTSGLYLADFYTIYEHNGKVIVIDEVTTHDDDDSRAEALAEKFVEVKNTLSLK